MFETRILSNSLLPVFKPSLHAAIKSVRSFAMVSRNRMQNLHRLLSILDREGIEGDIVETGIAKGGSTVFLAMLAGKSPLPRRVWAYDAFELYGEEGAGIYHEVIETIRDRFGFLDSEVHIEKGFFQDTLSGYPGSPISLYHVDAASYDGVMVCLKELYRYVQPGGFVVFDNYGSDKGCRDAVDEWLAENDLRDRLTPFGHTQAYFRKPK